VRISRWRANRRKGRPTVKLIIGRHGPLTSAEFRAGAPACFLPLPHDPSRRQDSLAILAANVTARRAQCARFRLNQHEMVASRCNGLRTASQCSLFGASLSLVPANADRTQPSLLFLLLGRLHSVRTCVYQLRLRRLHHTLSTAPPAGPACARSLLDVACRPIA
jgi:hypothetical protein